MRRLTRQVRGLLSRPLQFPPRYCGVTLVVVVTSEVGAGAAPVVVVVVVVRGFTLVRV